MDAFEAQTKLQTEAACRRSHFAARAAPYLAPSAWWMIGGQLLGCMCNVQTPGALTGVCAAVSMPAPPARHIISQQLGARMLCSFTLPSWLALVPAIWAILMLNLAAGCGGAWLRLVGPVY